MARYCGARPSARIRNSYLLEWIVDGNVLDPLVVQSRGMLIALLGTAKVCYGMQAQSANISNITV